MKITKDTIIADIPRLYPKAGELLKSKGMNCFECPTAQTGNMEHAALVHGYDLDELLEELNSRLV